MTALSFPHPSSMEDTWITVDCSDKPITPTVSPSIFLSHLVGVTQYCSVHSQLTAMAVCYLLWADHPLVSNYILLPYHSFKTCCCLQGLLACVRLAIQLVVVTGSLDEG